MRRFLVPLLLSTLVVNASCAPRAGTYEHVTSGMAVGAATGAMAGLVCCQKPSDAGAGALIGIAVGALVGYAIDLAYPVK